MNATTIVETTLETYNFLNFPVKYKEKLINVIDKAFELLGNNLLSITLGGSGGRGQIVEGWSDIDLYFVIKKYDMEKISELYQFKEGEIHVGLTFYTLKEVLAGNINSKTKVMIYEKNKYNYNPTIYGKDYFPDVTYTDIKENDIKQLPNLLSEYKKLITELVIEKNTPRRHHIKRMIILIKSILNYHNIFSFGYDDTILKFTRLCHDLDYELNDLGCIDILALIEDYENIKNYRDEIISFSMVIINFTHNFCLKYDIIK